MISGEKAATRRGNKNGRRLRPKGAGERGQSVPIITDDALMIAYASEPTFRLRRCALSMVIDDAVSGPDTERDDRGDRARLYGCNSAPDLISCA